MIFLLGVSSLCIRIAYINVFVLFGLGDEMGFIWFLLRFGLCDIEVCVFCVSLDW